MIIPVRQSLPVFSIEQIRHIEAACGPAAQPPLMERAGLAASRMAMRLLPETGNAKVLVMAGMGNNGGDGFVVARHLHSEGHQVQVVCLGDPARFPADAHSAYEIWLSAGEQLLTEHDPSNLDPTKWDLVVDALLGIGLQRPVQGIYEEWISWINQSSCPVLSLDIPSGLNADTGRVMGCAVRATHTITFIGLKPGLLMGDGPDLCGELVLDALDLEVSSHAAFQTSSHCIGRDDFAAALKPRLHNSHKGSYGEVGILGGAPGMLGAALLTGRAALRLGAGRVYLGLLESHGASVDFGQPELMLRPASELQSLVSVLAVGPGLGQTHMAKTFLESAFGFSGPLVLDADALNLIGQHEDLQTQLAQRGVFNEEQNDYLDEGKNKRQCVLTPHPAEAARLLQISAAQVQEDRIAAAQQIAARYQTHVVLKGCGTVIASPEGHWHINSTGHAGLATAGTGDVLTGFIVSLLAQGWPFEQALLGAVHLHGIAAEYLSAQGVGPIGLTAGELIDAARLILNHWVQQLSELK